MLKKVISGGQTGVDRLAVDVAILCDLEYGGLLPKGRKTEDGTVPEHYDKFDVANSADYMFRTRKNVDNADGTLVIVFDTLRGGSKNTADYAASINKPFLVLRYVDGAFVGNDNAAGAVAKFIEDYNISVLNVAGPRMSRIKQRGGVLFVIEFTRAVTTLLKAVFTGKAMKSIPTLLGD